MSVINLPTCNIMIFLSFTFIQWGLFYMSISLEPSTALTLNSCLLNKQNRFNKIFLWKQSNNKIKLCRDYVEISGFYEGYKKDSPLCSSLFTEINDINKINCTSSQVLAF